MNIWILAIIAYSGLALISLYPTLMAIFRKIELHDGGSSFEESTKFSDETKKEIMQQESRIRGTLHFWKKEAIKNRNFHYYCLIWTILSSTLIPILVQYVNDDPLSKLFITLISTHTVLLLALHRGLKVDKNFQSFRQGESEFYDLRRRLLDRPYTFGATQREQLDTYFEQVEIIRKYMRNTETDNFPALDIIVQKIKEESQE